MPKQKSHKATLKRMKITAKGRVKFKAPNAGHLMSHKTGAKVRSLRRDRVAKKGDIRRLERILHRPLLAADQDRRCCSCACEGQGETQP